MCRVLRILVCPSACRDWCPQYIISSSGLRKTAKYADALGPDKTMVSSRCLGMLVLHVLGTCLLNDICSFARNQLYSSCLSRGSLVSSWSAAAHIMASLFPPPNYIDDCFRDRLPGASVFSSTAARSRWQRHHVMTAHFNPATARDKGNAGLRRCSRSAQILVNDTAGSTSTTTSDLIPRAHKLGLQVAPVRATPQKPAIPLYVECSTAALPSLDVHDPAHQA